MVTPIQHDLSPLYYHGTIDYYTLTVPAQSFYPAGTVLGEIVSEGKLTAFSSDATDGSAKPMAILKVDVSNDTEKTSEITAAVIILGQVNAQRLHFIKPEDNLTAIVPNQGLVKTLLKNNGIIAITNQDLTEYR